MDCLEGHCDRVCQTLCIASQNNPYITIALQFLIGKWLIKIIGNQFRESNLEENCSFLLPETITGDSIGVEKVGLYKHWVTEFITIQALGSSLFQIQPVGQGKKGTDLSSDLPFQYEIDENEIKVG